MQSLVLIILLYSVIGGKYHSGWDGKTLILAKLEEEQVMKKYSVILADCPWKMKDTRNGDPAYAAITYNTMSTEDLCNLPVKEVADKDCALFMWVTGPMFEDCLKIIKAWGFKFKSVAFVWLKLNPRAKTPVSLMGRYTMSSCEYVLVATRGHPKRVCKNVKQLVQEVRSGHSVKPKEVHKRIEQLYGDVPRLELFARDIVDGWDCHGGDIDKRDIRDVLKEMTEE